MTVPARAFISDLDGLSPSADEKAFLRDERPWGLIVFKRNVASPEQLRDLTASFRDLVGRPDAPVLVDQEGGRVQRLGPPVWPDYPPARAFGRLYGERPEEGLRAARLCARLIAFDLEACGIDVDCLPVLDVPVAGADEVIGDRAYGTDVGSVVALARETVEGLMAGGVLPVMKHVPGHGRADADTHLAQPVTHATLHELDQTDFAAIRPFVHLPMAMTVHMVLAAVDPHRPATQSPLVIETIVRERLGFDGLLMTDDLSMQALGGAVGPRAARCIAAGCDVVLHCNDPLDARIAVARAVPELKGRALHRAERALAVKRAPEPFDADAAREELDALLAIPLAA